MKEQPENRGLFGGTSRENLLIVLNLLEESFPAELARIIKIDRSNVLESINRLEDSGVLVTIPTGRMRRVAFNPRYLAASELRSLLNKLSMHRPDLIEAAAEVRRSPRRAGKEL